MKILLATLHAQANPQAVPLAAGCLKAALPEAQRSSCQLIDLFPDSDPDTWLELLLDHDPMLIAFPLYSWNRLSILALTRRLRQARPEVLLVAGGPEASAAPREVLAEGELDGVISGEGELTWTALVSELFAGRSPESLPGLLWRDNPNMGLDPAPPLPLTEQTSPWLSEALVPAPHGGVLWETARGCIYSCAYCFDARGSHGVRHVPEGRLIAELELFTRHQVNQVWILDSTFNAPPERGKQLLRLLRQHAPQLHYHLEARAELLDPETIELLSQLNCSVQLGLQTTTPAALKVLHRSFDQQRFDHVCRLLNQHGVTFGIDLIYALPGDTHEGFVKSLDYALSQRPNQLDIFPLAVLPGTELFKHREALKIRAQHHPPYQVEMLNDYPPRDIRLSRELAEACDLFYTRGRAVGFFSSLLEVCNLSGSALLNAFSSWLQARLEASAPVRPDWSSDELLQLQLDFARHQLSACDQEHLAPALCDLIRFHFHYAETLLGAETPATAQPVPENLVNETFHCVPSLRLVDFHYEIQDLLDMEANGLDLEAFVDLFRPVGSTALFFRRGGEVACESLSDEFSLLLLNCQEGNRVDHLVDEQVGRDVMIELLTLAWEEGLLELATAAEADP